MALSKLWACALNLVIVSNVSTIFATTARASQIQSTCEYLQTDLATGSGPSQRPTQKPPAFDFLADKSNFARFVNFVTGLRGMKSDSYVDDLRLFFQSRLMEFDEAPNSAKCYSTPQWIEPYVIDYAEETKDEDLRVGFRICKFLNRSGRHLRTENSCRVVNNHSKGYSFRSIDNRFVRLNDTVNSFENSIRYTVWGAGALGSLLFLKGTARVAGVIGTGIAGFAIRSAIISIPAATSYAITEVRPIALGPIRRFQDVRDAAQLAVDGKIDKIIKVNMPIEVFEIILREYLDTIIPEDDHSV